MLALHLVNRLPDRLSVRAWLDLPSGDVGLLRCS